MDFLRRLPTPFRLNGSMSFYVGFAPLKVGGNDDVKDTLLGDTNTTARIESTPLISY